MPKYTTINPESAANMKRLVMKNEYISGMKKGLFLFILLFSALLVRAQKIELNGTYLGKNLYIQNPVANVGDGFCTEKVLVNGKEVFVAKSNAYEIKLDSLGFKNGDTINVEIFHKANCKPQVITQNYTPKGNFDLVSISVDSNGVLNWVSKNEINKLTYTIEQFRWNKWIKVGEVDGKGGIQENKYEFKTTLHSGINKFRVKQSASGKMRISKSADFEAPNLGINILGDQQKLADVIEFNKETMYELYDRYGNLVRKGTGKKIDIKNLERSFYYLNYDNKSAETITKFW